MINLTSMYAEKFSSFECGFHSFLGQNRSQFNVKFFIFGLVFLLFDLEITLVFPFAVSQSFNNLYGLIVVLIFLVIVTIGFIYELGKGALKIDSKQNIGGLKDNTTNTSISYVEKKEGGTNNSNTLCSGGNVLKNVIPSTFSFENVGGAKRFYSTKNKSSNDSLTHNSNIEVGANSACNNKASSPSLGKKFILFLMRTAFTMIGVIMVKSLFLCWYNNTYSILELLDNIESLSSVLVGIGYFTGISIGKLLDFTCFNINIRDLFIHSTFCKTNSKKLFNLLSLLYTNIKGASPQDKIHSAFFNSKILLGVDEVSGIKSKIKSKKFDLIFCQGNDSGNGGSRHIIRSKEDYLKSVDNAKKAYEPKPGETPEQFDSRMKKVDSLRWARSDKQNPIIDYTNVRLKRNPTVIWTKINALKEEFPQLPGETTEKWMDRLGNREKVRDRNLRRNPNYIPKRSNANPLIPEIITDDIRHNDPWDPKVENKKQYMKRTYYKASRIYLTGDTTYENNLPSSLRSGKRKRS